MKLSHIRKAFVLSAERQNIAIQLDDLRAGAEPDVQFDGWSVPVDADVADMLRQRALAAAESALERVDAGLVALGVEIDIASTDYMCRVRDDGCGDPRCGVCGFDEDADSEDDNADSDEATSNVQPATAGAAA